MDQDSVPKHLYSTMSNIDTIEKLEMILMVKMYQKGLGNKLSNELRFCRTNGRYDERNMQNVNILSKHHKRIIDWEIGYRNKYASQRWINDSRGCGYGCIVAQKRFIY